MRRKSVWVIIISIIVIIGCGLYLFTKKDKQNNLAQKQNDKAGLMIKNNKKDSKKSADDYSTDQWMLMGYMAYAHDNYVQSRHIKNTSDLVTDVNEDLHDGSLKAEATGKAQYHLTNKFGSVDVTVEDDDVKVTGDGSTYTSKSELKETFGNYLSQINKMAKTITKGSSSDSAKSEANLDDKELVVATFIDGFDGSSVQAKIQNVESMIKKDQTSNLDNFPRDQYLSGLYSGKNKGQFYYSVASSFSTSAYTCYYVNDTDRITVQIGGANLGLHGPKKYKSKSAILSKYKPYKQEIDHILQGLEYNKKQIPVISKAMAKKAEEEN